MVRQKDHPLWSIWSSMKTRCNNPNCKDYPKYGGRGIKVWWNSFEEFCNDMGTRPSSKHTLDRIDNNLGYYKKNCRWATYSEQAYNKSKAIRLTCHKGHEWNESNTIWTHNGKNKTRRCSICYRARLNKKEASK